MSRDNHEESDQHVILDGVEVPLNQEQLDAIAVYICRCISDSFTKALATRVPEKVVMNHGDVTQTGNRTLNIEEAGAILGISRPTSYKLANRDEFPVPIIRLGRRMVVSLDAVEALLSRQKEEQGNAA